ncbi:MAG: hypothetical protein U1D97_13840 [Desulfuromonadales bacterium]|nr:hypothetical protein [Desulfuromonadales bacterium]
MTPAAIVSKLWNFCNVLRDDSMSYLRMPTGLFLRPGTGRWRGYDYAELIARDKASLDIFWLKDDSLEDSDSLPTPGVLAAEIVEDLQALEQFRLIAEDLGEEVEEV